MKILYSKERRKYDLFYTIILFADRYIQFFLAIQTISFFIYTCHWD